LLPFNILCGSDATKGLAEASPLGEVARLLRLWM